MAWEEIKLAISDEVKQILEERHIPEDDIKKVIAQAEEEGKKLFQPGSDLFLSKNRLGSYTLYVEYSSQDDAYLVHTAYQHRARIQ
jgi:hypothetical protein